ncbi:MAG: helix-turn-helix transcriptional regulator [Solirubrobacteraceae bacterium]
MLAQLDGAVSEAVANAWSAVTTATEIRLAPVTLAFLVEALVERGDLDTARSELAERGMDGDLPYAWATTPLLLARGRLRAAAGEHPAAIADLIDTGGRAEAWGVRNPAMHPWRSSAAISLAQVGDRDRAIALAEEEIQLARTWGAPRAVGVALRAAGIAHGGEHGIALLRDAVAVLEPSTAPLEHARAITDLGSALRRAGHRAEAREHLRTALHVAHQLGGGYVSDRARKELAIAGARPRRDALRGRDALTPSELRVAQRAAEGRTNREIAQNLFITLRAVEAHLTSSYTKLGIASRHELPAALSGSTSEPR